MPFFKNSFFFLASKRMITRFFKVTISQFLSFLTQTASSHILPIEWYSGKITFKFSSNNITFFPVVLPMKYVFSSLLYLYLCTSVNVFLEQEKKNATQNNNKAFFIILFFNLLNLKHF